MPQIPFERLGPYQIQRVLGRGGMGTVFAAVNIQTSEPAAVKVLSTGLADDESFRERFIAEIESLKKLSHPHIVRLYGYGREEGNLFYAMELVEGISLEHELSQGRRFDWREVSRIAIEICGALKHAHDHGVIHRDLKPANLLLETSGRIKLLDFGIAKIFGVTNMTANGNVLGTADYMAPEQALGKPSTPRCDLYSLGSVMYALLSGYPPFRGKTIAEVVHKLQSEAPIPIERLAPDIPDEMAQVIHELLRKSPDARIPTALALSHRLKSMEHALATRLQEPAPNPVSGAAIHSSPTVKIPRPPGMPANTSPPDAPTREIAAAGSDIASRATVPIPTGQLGQTNVAGQPTQVQSTQLDQLDIDLDERAVTVKTDRVGDQKTQEVGEDTETHFTQVDPKESWKTAEDEESTASHGIVLAIASIAIALLIGLVWYQAKPPTADELYAAIEQAMGQDQIDNSTSAAPLLKRFLANYPDDARCEQAAAYQEQTELYRLQRQYEGRARRGIAGSGLTPAEQHYLEALRHANSDPDEAVRQMQGLIAMYADETDDGTLQTKRCISLARRQIVHLRKAAVKNATRHRNLIRERMAAAAEFAELAPGDAAEILDGIITLYERHEWANEFVVQAREMRTRIDIPPSNDAGQSTDAAVNDRAAEAREVAEDNGDDDAER